MSKPKTMQIVAALLASSGIIAFAFYSRYEASYKVPVVVFYIAAAVCLLPVVSTLVRCKLSRHGDLQK